MALINKVLIFQENLQKSKINLKKRLPKLKIVNNQENSSIKMFILNVNLNIKVFF